CVGEFGRAEGQVRLEELASLAHTAGLSVVGGETIRLRHPDAATLIGRGRLESLSIEALNRGATLLLFDTQLSPAQVQNLGEATELKIIDRTQLILDIFAKHARSREGKLQVELAQQRYRLPRLVGRNPALSRLAGGIGGQGPGETKLEIDRRRARDRIRRLERELEHLERRRGFERKARLRHGAPVVSLVGYTNAGKSTLFNRLTRQSNGKGALVANQLFATLDPTTRRLSLALQAQDVPGAPEWCLMSDTVGFIRDLPEDLVRSFHATLEELRDASLLVHVVDASSPHWREQREAVSKTLVELGLADLPCLTVYNKADLIAAEDREAGWPGLLVSAEEGEGLAAIRLAIAQILASKEYAREEERRVAGQLALA
ncbi:MAG: GTPase HflX, partial [Bdellovibrionota bacterium]